jgi:hypothetical protein
LENHRAGNVAREQIRRELDALEMDTESGAEGADEKRLGEARHTLEKDVAIGEEGDEQPFDGGVLTDDGFTNFSAEFLGPSGTVEHVRNRGSEFWERRVKKERGGRKQ